MWTKTRDRVGLLPISTLLELFLYGCSDADGEDDDDVSFGWIVGCIGDRGFAVSSFST